VSTADAACKNVRYEHIFGSTKEQKEAIVLFSRLLYEKEKILESNPPGEKLDPSMGSILPLL